MLAQNSLKNFCHVSDSAKIMVVGECWIEDLKVTGSIPGFRNLFACAYIYKNVTSYTAKLDNLSDTVNGDKDFNSLNF